MFLNWDFALALNVMTKTINCIVVFWDVAESRPVLGPTQPPIQWMLGIFALEYSSSGLKLVQRLMI